MLARYATRIAKVPYRVTLVVAYLGCVVIPLSAWLCLGRWEFGRIANRLVNRARWWNIKHLSQPNHYSHPVQTTQFYSDLIIGARKLCVYRTGWKCGFCNPLKFPNRHEVNYGLSRLAQSVGVSLWTGLYKVNCTRARPINVHSEPNLTITQLPHRLRPSHILFTSHHYSPPRFFDRRIMRTIF